MFGIDVLPGFIMGIREGLEAFLIIAIMLEFLKKTNRENEKKYVVHGLVYGIIASLLFGALLFGISSALGSSGTNISKLWESITSFLALILITTFIYHMIMNRKKIFEQINSKMSAAVSKVGIILLASVMVAREGAEIVLFVAASPDKFSYFSGAMMGVVLAAILSLLIYKSLVKVNLKLIFSITLFYLILQAGFMLGYSVHEFLSYLKAEEIVSGSHAIYTKLFDLSDTFLYHKEQPVGIILYATLGWYSKPEIIQFVVQYVYTGILLIFFFKKK